MTAPDFKSAGWETAKTLSELIRIDSSNPPGNESKVCDYLRPLYEKMGLATETVEPEKGRGSIIARTGSGDGKPPLLLLSHIDVVPAKGDGWTKAPFSGEIEDDIVWGRGALDCKNATAVECHALKLFLENQKSGRDIIIAATADEEAGGELGVGYILQNRPELLDAGYCINEGGGFGISLGEQEVYFCQTAEKGVCWLKLTARGEEGHASVPQDYSAMDRIVDALYELRRFEQPVRVSGVVKKLAREFIKAMEGEPDEDITDEAISEVLMSAARTHEVKRIFKALIRNTCSITTISGGSKTNVIPGLVEATLDYRLVPGIDPLDMIDEVRRVVSPFGVEVEPTVTNPATETEPGGELYDALEQVISEVRPNSRLAPFMVPGGTDGRLLVENGMSVLGFVPVLAETGGGISVLRRAHAVDERTGVADLAFGVEVIYRLLQKFCG